MRILEPGHVYALQNLDAVISQQEQLLMFVNREDGRGHPGTQTQEVIRALIDRVQYCDSALPWKGNNEIIYHLRMALVLHESRVLVRKTEKGIMAAETIEVGPDGHFLLKKV